MTRVVLCMAMVVLPILSACSGVASTVTEQVKGTVSGALVPLKESVEEVSRRANEVGEGIHEMREGVQRVKGALSGSGATW